MFRDFCQDSLLVIPGEQEANLQVRARPRQCMDGQQCYIRVSSDIPTLRPWVTVRAGNGSQEDSWCPCRALCSRRAAAGRAYSLGLALVWK